MLFHKYRVVEGADGYELSSNRCRAPMKARCALRGRCARALFSLCNSKTYLAVLAPATHIGLIAVLRGGTLPPKHCCCCASERIFFLDFIVLKRCRNLARSSIV